MGQDIQLSIKRQPRQSGVELYKAFAIIFIVICHAFEGTNWVSIGKPSMTEFWLTSLGGLGLLGDVIFLVCSSYFLLDSKQFKLRKVLYMLFTVLIISLVYFVIYISLGYQMDAMTIVKQFFPTIFQNNWFISYYLVLYIIHPLLNKIIERLNKLTLGCVAGYLFIHCCIVLFAIGKAPSTHKFLCMLAIYFIVAWLKLYAPKLMNSTKANVIIFIVSFLAYWAMRVALYLLSFKVSFISNYGTYFHIFNPVQLVMCISMLNLAMKAKWHSKAVNFVSSLSMLIYLISHNNLFVAFTQYKWNGVFGGAFGEGFYISRAMILAVIYFVGSLIAASLFTLALGKPLRLLCAKMESGITSVVQKAVTSIKNKKSKQEPAQQELAEEVAQGQDDTTIDAAATDLQECALCDDVDMGEKE